MVQPKLPECYTRTSIQSVEILSSDGKRKGEIAVMLNTPRDGSGETPYVNVRIRVGGNLVHLPWWAVEEVSAKLHEVGKQASLEHERLITKLNERDVPYNPRAKKRGSDGR